MENGFLFEFTTTLPKVIEFKPQGTVSTLKPKCFLLFNQKIDHKQILKHLRIVDNKQHHISNDEFELLEDTDDKDKCVAFTFKNDLSKATEYTVRLPPGCPSIEGPLTSTEEWSTRFKTYEPLKIVDWHPNAQRQYEKSIDPDRDWSIKFNNILDRSTVTKSLFNIQPEITDLNIELSEQNTNQIIIQNNSKVNTVYTVNIKPGLLKDIYGQILEHDFAEQPVQFHVHDSSPLKRYLSGATGILTKT